MHRRNIYLFIAVAFLLIAAVSCSTKRNTASVRAYHELTTRYNVYFNAEMAYEESLRALYDNHQDDYSRLLPMYPNSSVPGDTVAKQPGGAFDRTIEKTTFAIQEHSISAKPLRDPSRMQNDEYRRWLQQDEFNPFIDQAWLLMGKAHVQNGDYAQAVAVFNRAIRLFDHDMDVISEAQVWLLRAYTEMEWFTDAEIVASTLNTRQLKGNLHRLFNEFYTFYLFRRGGYHEAVPFLEQTVKEHKNSYQKQRLQFLLGQTYALLGETEKSYAAFEKLKGLTIPHSIEIHAILEQAAVADDINQTLTRLSKMVKRPKNKEYLDQIYFSIGNIHLHVNNDIESALSAFRQAEEKGTGIYKQLAQLAQGDIYFNLKQFDQAAPKYQNAASQLSSQHPYYDQTKHRAEVLQQLLPHLLSVKEQDSLRLLAALSPAEQVKIIEDKIRQLKAEERKAGRELKREQMQVTQVTPISTTDETVEMPLLGSQSTFYFYNEQLVLRGKQQFHSTWGNRKLEDNWRLSDKGGLSRLDDEVWDFDSEVVEPTQQQDENVKVDIYSVDYYLRNIPASQEDFIVSDSIIGEGLYAIGGIAVTRLYEFEWGYDNFARYLNEFSDGKYRLPIYHQLYLMALRNGGGQDAQYYKGLIITEHPESELAEKMTDPDYDYIMQNYAEVERQLYSDALKGHKAGDVPIVRENYKKAFRFFDNSSYLPPLKLMHALTFVREPDSVAFRVELQELVTNYQSTPQSELAQSILEGMDQGKTLVSSSLLSSFEWDPVMDEEPEDSVQFSIEPDESTSWLLFRRGSEKKNELLFAVSDFNFTHFQKRFFPVSFVDISAYTALQVDGFSSQEEALAYNEMLQSDPQLLSVLADSLHAIILSHSNRELLQGGQRSLEEYLHLYNQLTNNDIAILKPHPHMDAESQLGTIFDEVKEEKKVVEPLIPVVTQDKIIQVESESEANIDERLKELEQKEAIALSEAEEVMSEKDKRKALKERERERNKLLKERRRILKQKEKERKAELKQRERERKKKLKEQNRLRKEKLKARQRVLKKQNR